MDTISLQVDIMSNNLPDKVSVDTHTHTHTESKCKSTETFVQQNCGGFRTL